MQLFFRYNIRYQNIYTEGCDILSLVSFAAFEEESDKPSVVIAVPGIEGRICHISQDMKEHLHQLRTARKQGLQAFPTTSDNAAENSDSD